MRNLMTAALAAALAVITPAALEAQKKPAKEPSPLARSESIMLPKVMFTELRLDEVARQLTELSAKADPSGKGVRVVYAGPKDKVPTVSMDFTNISLSSLLRIVAQSVDYRANARDDAVALEPK